MLPGRQPGPLASVDVDGVGKERRPKTPRSPPGDAANATATPPPCLLVHHLPRWHSWRVGGGGGVIYLPALFATNFLLSGSIIIICLTAFRSFPPRPEFVLFFFPAGLFGCLFVCVGLGGPRLPRVSASCVCARVFVSLSLCVGCVPAGVTTCRNPRSRSSGQR